MNLKMIIYFVYLIIIVYILYNVRIYNLRSGAEEA
jgi:hypothetical protein